MTVTVCVWQLMYFNSEPTKKLRRTVCLGLELWHSYKMASMLIYRKHTLAVFAPLFHHLCPGNTYKYKQASKSMLKMHYSFTCLRLAFDKDMEKKFAAVHANPQVLDHQKDVLRVLRDLIRFYIPVVRTRCVCGLSCVG